MTLSTAVTSSRLRYAVYFIAVVSVNILQSQAAINSVDFNTQNVGIYEKIELTVDLEALYSNPFDYGQMSLQAQFISPGGGIYNVDGFYFQSYNIQGNGSLFIDGPSEWKVRFAPHKIGVWSVQLYLSDFFSSAESELYSFECISSDNPGFIRSNHPRYLEYDNGDQYFAIGENMGWYSGSGTNDYELWMNNLSAADGNFIRVWMCSWATAIEWDNTGLGNYTNRMSRAYQLDWIIEHAEDTGIYIMLALNNHGQVSTNVNPEWQNNPYNAANGGPCNNTWDFFTNELARSYYERRMRYIIARWGYSTNILTWEHFNEVEWTDDFNLHQDEITTWHQDMSEYITGLDVYNHLITTSYAHSQHDPDTWQLPGIELTQTHHYTSGADPQSVHYDWTQQYLADYAKPTLVGEFGIDNFLENDPSGIHFHNSLWVSALSGSFGTAMIWWWDNYIQPNNLYSNYSAVSSFMSDADLLQQNYNTIKPVCLTEENSDLQITPGYTNWGQAPENDFTILPDGSIYPSAAGLGRYLFGAQWNTEHRNPPTFHVNYSEIGYFEVHTGPSSGQSPTIRIMLDGEEQFNVPASVNSIYSIPVPAGEHDIFVSNQGTDWIEINVYVFSNIVNNARAFALQSEDRVLGWVQNRNYNWYYVLNNGTPDPVQNVQVQMDLAEGDWQVTWKNCENSEVVGSDEFYSNGAVLFDVPELAWDLSFDLQRMSGYCEPNGDANLDNIVNIVDIVVIVGYIIDQGYLDDLGLCQSDLNQDGSVDVLDIVAVVEIIVS